MSDGLTSECISARHGEIEVKAQGLVPVARYCSDGGSIG